GRIRRRLETTRRGGAVGRRPAALPGRHHATQHSRRQRGGGSGERDGVAGRHGQSVHLHDASLPQAPARDHRSRRRAHRDRGGRPQRRPAACRRMSLPATRQRCASCGYETSESDSHTRCPRCQGLLELHHAETPADGPALARLFDERLGVRTGPYASGVWRFREAVLPAASGDVVSYPEGNTPLLHRAAVSEWAGVAGLLLKHEGLNPTGSFKDRGMTVGVTQARRTGATAVACASTGNTGASLAAYAALAGLPALVIVPQGQIAVGKLAQALAYGARTLVVRANFDRCLELAGEASQKLGVYLLNSINPFRLEGQKTIVFELLQQLGWEPPDWIVV